jgi:hypothetical protein
MSPARVAPGPCLGVFGDLSALYATRLVVSPTPYDVAFGRIRDLAADMVAAEKSRNEATTRLQLIDRLIFDCLGWSREEALLEDHEDGEYADYVLDRAVRLLVVEAKREGAWFELPTHLARVTRLDALYALRGGVAAALDQVEQYAQRRGSPFAVICNGHQLVAFVASRQDGVAPRSGRALVFDSPKELVDGFHDLWETLTPHGTATRRLTRRLNAAVATAPPKLSEHIRDYPGRAKAGELIYTLSTLNVLFLPAFVRDDEHEEEFLRECYCPPSAYSQLAILNRSVLRTRYSTALGEELRVGLEQAQTKEGLNPALVDEVAVTAAGREPLVLLGGVGVGKTMFLRRLLRVDAKELAENAVVLYVDLGRSAVLEDLRSYIAGSFRNQLYERYDVDIDAGGFVRGTYHDEVRRFTKGVNAELKELDPNEFKRREIDHLTALTAHPEDHLRRSLEHLVKLRAQQVIVVLDNIDQRGREEQDQVFLIAETMAKGWPCTVFVTLRPDTFNASRVHGALSGYQPRAFTIDAPRVDRVVVERLKFGERHYDREGRLPLWLGWTADSADVRAYLKILLKSFSRHEKLQSTLVNLAGANARRGLELVSEFVQSPHADPAALLQRNKGPDDYLVPHHVFLRAVLLGDARYYHPQRSRIPNLFDISASDVREHFLLPCLLGVLRRASEQQDSEGYVAVDEVFGSFQNAGFDPDQINFALRRGRDGALYEPLPPDGDLRGLRLTTVGAYAHQLLAAEFQYIDVVVVDTPVADPAVRSELADVHSVRQRMERAETFLRYLDTAWEASDLGALGLFDWPRCASAVRVEIAFIAKRL